MVIWDAITGYTRRLSEDLQWLGNESIRTPIIGNWCADKLFDVSVYLLDSWIQMVYIGRWIDDAEFRLTSILSWDTIRGYILGSWSWLNDIWGTVTNITKSYWPWLDDPWGTVRTIATSYWSWLNTIDDKIFQRVRSVWPWIDDVYGAINHQVLSSWSFLNTIDDRIRQTVTARWTWLNTIDDRIRDIAWSHIAPKLGDWFWSFVVLEVTQVSKIGYRVFSTLWNMEWDDKNKEAK
ncbi:MAG: hypothetical protein NTU91_14380 [Chloroflexi bacterium]|nr:hypothetical protein [Chloroflexota bacterium]